MSRALPDASRRGWCPSLARPMPTGDGLLARVHPPDGRVTPAQLRALAEAARKHGNGLIDITGRANLQLRGITEATRGALACALAAAGLADAREDGGPQRLTLASPLSGLDPAEAFDVPALARAIEAVGHTIQGLPAKTLVAIDGGGLCGPGSAEADILLTANATSGVALALAGPASPFWCGVFPPAGIPGVVGLALKVFARIGKRRMRDLDDGERALVAAATGCREPIAGERIARPGLEPGSMSLVNHSAEPHVWPARACQSVMDRASPRPLGEGDRAQRGGVGGTRDANPDRTLPPPPSASRPPPPWGEERWRSARPDDPVAIVVEAPFGRCDAEQFDRVAGLAGEAVRLTASRGIVVVVPIHHAQNTREALEAVGFITKPDDPRRAIAACPGAPGCHAGSTPAPAHAAELARAFAPFAASGHRAHVSGCAKGCAHPALADLTLVAETGRYGVVLHGSPGDTPAQFMTFEAVIERVSTADPRSPLRQAFSR